MRIFWLTLASLVALLGPAWAAQGWYLTFPPMREQSKDSFSLALELPLKHWTQQGAFDSARECEAARADLIERTRRLWESSLDRPKDDHTRNLADVVARQTLASACLISDDPRLR